MKSQNKQTHAYWYDANQQLILLCCSFQPMAANSSKKIASDFALDLTSYVVNTISGVQYQHLAALRNILESYIYINNETVSDEV
jgi:hypothetical protein